MSAPKHTPGPWIACGYWVEHPDDRQNDICNCDPASMHQQGRSDSEIRANTVLIAAAPDLLSELEAAHCIIRHALAVMTTEQKDAWGRLNTAANVDGEGITRANERAAVIANAGGTA